MLTTQFLRAAVLASLCLVTLPAHAEADEAPIPVKVDGPPGTWIEERDRDDSWRFVCNLPCEAPMLRAARHRVVDGKDVHRISIPRHGDHPVVRYTPPGAPEGLVVAGAVVGAAGATVAILGVFVAIETAIQYRDPDPEAPRPRTPTTGTTMMVGGGITVLVGAALALSGGIAKATRPSSALVSPLGFRFLTMRIEYLVRGGLFAVLSLAAVPARAADAGPVSVKVEGPIGTWIEERDPDDQWRFVCNLPCEAPMLPSAEHRIVDGEHQRRVRIPRHDDHPVIRYDHPDLPRGVIILGAVVAAAGTTAAFAGLVNVGLGSLRWYDDSPSSTNHYTRTGDKLLLGGGIAILVGGALVLTGVIARRPTPAATAATPLGFRF